MSDLLFVYGTLMRQFDHPMARLVAEKSDPVGAAEFNGVLYLVGAYPGAVDSADATGTVFGDLYRLRDPAFLARLDAYEGCGPDDAAPTEYVRELRAVTCGGRAVEAWIYLYNWPVGHLRRIESGRFSDR